MLFRLNLFFALVLFSVCFSLSSMAQGSRGSINVLVVKDSNNFRNYVELKYNDKIKLQLKGSQQKMKKLVVFDVIGTDLIVRKIEQNRQIPDTIPIADIAYIQVKPWYHGLVQWAGVGLITIGSIYSGLGIAFVANDEPGGAIWIAYGIPSITAGIATIWLSAAKINKKHYIGKENWLVVQKTDMSKY